MKFSKYDMKTSHPKLSDDSGKVPKLDGAVGGSILGYEIISLLDGKLASWSSASCVPKKTKKKERYED